MVKYIREDWEKIYESPAAVHTVEVTHIDFENGKYKVRLFMPDVGVLEARPQRDSVVVDYLDLGRKGYTILGARPKKYGTDPFMSFGCAFGTKMYVYKNKKSGRTLLTDHQI